MIVMFAGSSVSYPCKYSTKRPHGFYRTSGKINEFMKMHVTITSLVYKKNIKRLQESPAIKIIEEHANLGANVLVYDPVVLSLETKAGVFSSAGSIDEAFTDVECWHTKWTTMRSGGSLWRL